MTTLVLFCPKCKESRKFETVGSAADIKCRSCGGPLFFEEAIASPDASAELRAQGLKVGGIFGDFEIISELGAGGMGKVYKAKHTKLNRTVALKVMKPEFAEIDPDHAARLQREAQAAAQLIHPNIVTLFSVGEHDGLSYIEMEYIPGPSAGKMVEDRGSIDLELAVSILRDSASGLAAAHKLRIVHRDIKPDNILIHPDGMAKVGDFGLAKSFDEDGPKPSESAELKANITMPGIAIGTPHFMSPEQCEAQKLDGRSDIYSLGCTFYYLLTGAQPYRGESTMGVMRQHLFDPPPDITIDNPDIDDEVAHLIFRMMEKDLEKRYQTCQELIEDIDALELPDGESSGSHLTVEFRNRSSEATVRQTRKDLSKRGTSPSRKATKATQASEPQSDSMAPLLGGVAVSLLIIIVAGALFYFRNGDSNGDSPPGPATTTVAENATIPPPATTSISAAPVKSAADLEDFSRNKFPTTIEDVTLDEKNMVIAAAGDNSFVYIWKLLDDAEDRIEHSDRVAGVRFSPTGNILAAVAGSTIKTWEKGTLAPYKEFKTDVTFTCCDFSLDGTVFATGSKSGVHIWDLESGRKIQSLAVDINITCIAAGSEPRTLVAGTSNGEVYYWKDFRSKPDIVPHKERTDEVGSVSLSRDDRWLTFTHSNSFYLKDLVTGQVYEKEAPGKFLRVTALPDKSLLAVGLDTGLVWFLPPTAIFQDAETESTPGWVWRFHGEKEVKGSDWFHRLHFTPSGDWLLSCSYNGEVALQRTNAIKRPAN